MLYVLAYPADIKEIDGEQIITFPHFPEAMTSVPIGKDPYPMARDCLSEALASRILDGEAIEIRLPNNTDQYSIMPDELIGKKAVLHQGMREEEMTTADLARLLNVDHKEARRILDPRHPTKNKRLQEAQFAINRMYYAVGLVKAAG
jgi:antitoxin HicB